MPQDGWVTLGSAGNNDDDGWTTLGGQQEETPWYENIFTVPNAIRFGGSALGAVGAGLASGGLGAAAGAFAGGAAGEAAARWWEGKEFDPTITAVEGALNVLPGGGAIPGKGAALKEIAKYGLKAAGHGAWQGAVGSLPRHQAERGNLWDWNKWEWPSAGEIGSQTLAGTVVGGTVGTTLGAANVKYRNRMGAEGPPPKPDIGPSPGLPENWLPFGDVPQERPPVVPQPEPIQPQLPFDDPTQPGLPFGAYRGARGRYTNTGPGTPTRTRPFLEEPIPQEFNFGPPEPPAGGGGMPTPQAPQAPEARPNVVTIQFPEASVIEAYKNQGYVSVPGMRSPEGYIQMVDSGVAPLYMSALQEKTTLPTEPPKIARPEVPGPMSASEVPAGDAIPVPNENVNQVLIDNLKNNGYAQGERGPTHTIFKRFMEGEEGHFDPEALWLNLRRMLGREPNVNELEAAIAHEPQQNPMEMRGQNQLRNIADASQPPAPEFSQDMLLTPDELRTPDIPPTRGPAMPHEFQPDVRMEDFQVRPTADVPQQVRNEFSEDMLLTPDELRTPDIPPQPGPAMPHEFAPDPAKAELDAFVAGKEVPSKTGIVEKIKTIAKNFIEDESGTADYEELWNRVRALTGGDEPYPGPHEGERTRIPEDATLVRSMRATEGNPEARAALERADINDIETTNHVAGGRELVDFWREQLRLANTTDSVDAQKHAANMLRQSQQRLRVLEDEAPFNEADEPARPPFGGEEPDVRNARTAEEFRILHEQWENNYQRALSSGDVEGVRQAERMQRRINRAEQRIERNDASGYDLERTMGIESITDDAHLAAMEREWIRRLEHANDNDIVDGPNGSVFIERVLDRIARRREDTSNVIDAEAYSSEWEPIYEPVEPGGRPYEPEPRHAGDVTDQSIIEERARNAPPITFGLQPKRTEPLKISREQLARLEHAVGPYRRDELAAQTRERRTNPELAGQRGIRRQSWDEWAQEYLESADERGGPPGLSIEDHSSQWSNYNKEYHIVYRDPQGKAVAVAQVVEDIHTGKRGVHTLASDRFRGLLTGRAVKAVAEKILEINAGEARGSISEFTARIIGRASKLLSEDGGTFDLHQVGETIRRIRDSILGGQPLRSVPLKSVDDVAKLIDNMADGKTGVQRITKFAKDFIKDESGELRPGEAWENIKAKTGWGQGATKGGRQDPKEFNWVREALAVPSAATTTGDFSAPGRQGLSMILTPQFWKAAAAMFKGLSPESFKQIDAELKAKPIFQKKVDLNTGKVSKSFAEEIGMKLFRPASEAGPRAEAVASRWLETGGSIPYVSAAYRNTVGVPVRATNRAFITFLNHLNANRTEFLLNKARDMSIEALDTGSARPGIFRQKYTPTQAQDLNPYHNITLAKEIADFVNTATGHGPLKMHVLPFKQTEVSLEKYAGVLNMALFSPGLLASRARMVNPSTYIMASPFVRKQYLKAALSTAAAWYAFTTLIKNAGGNEVEVNNENLTSADFGKIRIGDTRLDPGGGFLQFLVAYGRLYQGGSTSSSTGEFHRFGSGYQAQTQEDMMERFMVNKLNPVAKFAWDLASASEYNPFHVKDRLAQLFVPLIAQDVIGLASEDPDLVPWLTPAAALGMGTQTYSKGESVGKLIDPENDWLTTGGGIRDLMPWNQNEF